MSESLLAFDAAALALLQEISRSCLLINAGGEDFYYYFIISA
jgi:hypothetical protein